MTDDDDGTLLVQTVSVAGFRYCCTLLSPLSFHVLAAGRAGWIQNTSNLMPSIVIIC